MTSKRSSAFTLVELLVVIAIIGMLAALALPAINSAVSAARRTTCGNNQREFGQAILAYSTRKAGDMPGYRKGPAPAMGVNPRIMTWQVSMMPELGRTDVYEAIQTAFQNGQTISAAIGDLPFWELSVCPEDFTITDKSNPWTSYVANTGKWDITLPDSKATGVFHDHYLKPGNTSPVKFSTSDIKDGAATTLMLAENMDAGRYMNKVADDLDDNSERGTGFVWWHIPPPPPVTEPSLPNAVAGINRNKGEYDPATAGWPGDITGSPQPGHFAARPAGGHNGGVVVVYCAGNSEFLREDIDYSVLCRLMAPHDTKANLPTNKVLSESEFK